MKNKKIALLYRKDNPLLERLEKEFQVDFTDVISLDPKDKRTEYPGNEKYLKEISRDYDIIFTDNTMFTDDVGTMWSYGLKNAFSVYKFIEKENWLENVGQLVDHYKRNGKDVVINSYGLTHHLSNIEGLIENLEKTIGAKKSEELKKKSNVKVDELQFTDRLSSSIKDYYLAYLLGETLGVKVVHYGPFEKNAWKGRKKITDALSDIGTNPNNSVVLVDHHVKSDVFNYFGEGKGINETGFDKVKVYPICSCCIDSDGAYFREDGFNADKGICENVFFPTIVKAIKEFIKK